MNVLLSKINNKVECIFIQQEAIIDGLILFPDLSAEIRDMKAARGTI